MSLQDLGSLGEFIAAIAVIASLVYLGIQIRQNTRALRAGSFQQYRQQQAEVSRLLAEPGMAEVYRKGLDCPDQLTGAERTQFEAILVFAFNAEENFFLQREMGLIDDNLWAGGRTFYFRWLLKHDEPTEWWIRNRKMFSRSFCDFVEGFRVKDADPDGGDADRP